MDDVEEPGDETPPVPGEDAVGRTGFRGSGGCP
jgi:hypothetical protein